MLCPNCGRIITNNAPFCHHCGITIENNKQQPVPQNDKPKSAYWNKRPPSYNRALKKKHTTTDIFITVFIVFIITAVIVLAALLFTGV